MQNNFQSSHNIKYGIVELIVSFLVILIDFSFLRTLFYSIIYFLGQNFCFESNSKKNGKILLYVIIQLFILLFKSNKLIEKFVCFIVTLGYQYIIFKKGKNYCICILSIIACIFLNITLLSFIFNETSPIVDILTNSLINIIYIFILHVHIRQIQYFSLKYT